MARKEGAAAPVERIHVLGPAGTFSDRAASAYSQRMFTAGSPPVVVHTRTIEEALANAAGDPASVAIVPIENSETGTVIPTQEQLRTAPVSIELELSIPVRYSLISYATAEQVRQVFCHPLAHGQCSRFLRENLPEAEVVFASSNAQAGVELARLGPGSAAAAIVPSEYAAEGNYRVVAHNVQNSAFNTTRFVVVRARSVAPEPDFTRQKTSLVILPKHDRPGLLADLLSAFARRAINVTRIESRPSRERPWNYVFFVDIQNNAAVAEAAREVGDEVQQLVILGTYDSLIVEDSVPPSGAA
jgi:prephenate dehydratase